MNADAVKAYGRWGLKVEGSYKKTYPQAPNAKRGTPDFEVEWLELYFGSREKLTKELWSPQVPTDAAVVREEPNKHVSLNPRATLQCAGEELGAEQGEAKLEAWNGMGS